MRAQGTNGTRPPDLSDREIWRRSQETEAARDEAAHLMDLAAFAERRLDPDETARVAALVVRDADAATDIAAARALADAAITAADPGVIARAEALVGQGGRPAAVFAEAGLPEAVLIAFPAPRPVSRPWYGAATWSGLAAAMVMAGWLGFALGSGFSTSPVFGRPIDDLTANELLDATPLMLRDLNESSQI